MIKRFPTRIFLCKRLSLSAGQTALREERVPEPCPQMLARESRHKKFLAKVPIRKSLSEKFKQDLLVETGLTESREEISCQGYF